MDVRSIIWSTLTILWSVHSLKLEPLGHYTEGIYLVHDVPHPISSARHVREVARSSHHGHHDGFLPFKYCCGDDNNTDDSRQNESNETFSQMHGCLNELGEEDEWTTNGNPTKDPFSCEKLTKLKNNVNCFLNCLMRTRGDDEIKLTPRDDSRVLKSCLHFSDSIICFELEDDGTENIEKWEDHATKYLAFPWLKDLAVTAFHKCVANKDYTWLENGDKLKCSPRIMNVEHCVWREIVVTCPEEHFVKSHYTEGIYLVHDVPHPISSARHVREVARSSHHRNHGGYLPFKYCCGGDNYTVDSRQKDSNETFSQIARCFDELEEEDEWAKYGNPIKDPFSNEKIINLRNNLICLFNCLIRSYGVLEDDGTENIEKWEDHATKYLAFPWLKDLAVTAFHKCVANKDYIWLENGDKLKCSPRIMNVEHCVWREIVVTCPEEHSVKNAYCKRVKQAFEEVDG